MASTQYQIFCKYLNENTNKIVNNSSEKTWISAQEWYQAKIAYNVTDKDASNAMTLAVDSANTSVKKGSTYRELYDALKLKMENVDPETKTRLRYPDLTVEEKKVYDLCKKYPEILDMLANDKCVIEYAMIRPPDDLVVVTPIATSVSISSDFYHGGPTKGDFSTKKFKQTTKKELEAAAKTLDNDLSKIIYSQIDATTNEKYNMLFTFNGMVKTDEQLDGWVCEGSLCAVRNYRFHEDDSVMTYTSSTWNGGSNITKPGEEYEIGGAPIKCFNGVPTTPTNSSSSSNNNALAEVTFPDVEREICTAVYEGMERLQVQPWFLITTCNSLKSAMTKVQQLIDIYGKDAVKLGKVVPLEQYIEIV